jgi:hypothetical protein
MRRDSGVMTTAQTEALIGMLTALGILVLLVLPSLIGIARDRRADRQIREAERARGQAGDSRPQGAHPVPRQACFTTTVTDHPCIPLHEIRPVSAAHPGREEPHRVSPAATL